MQQQKREPCGVGVWSARFTVEKAVGADVPLPGQTMDLLPK
jgi:hypothetical protein